MNSNENRYNKMKIGIIGTGNMGRSLGILWAEKGHEVFFASRDSLHGMAIAQTAGHGSKGGTNDEAAAFNDVMLYTTRAIMPSTVLSSTDVLASKVLIDCNNWDIQGRLCLRTNCRIPSRKASSRCTPRSCSQSI